MVSSLAGKSRQPRKGWGQPRTGTQQLGNKKSELQTRFIYSIRKLQAFNIKKYKESVKRSPLN